jgi:hypothetical protein
MVAQEVTKMLRTWRAQQQEWYRRPSSDMQDAADARGSSLSDSTGTQSQCTTPSVDDSDEHVSDEGQTWEL